MKDSTLQIILTSLTTIMMGFITVVLPMMLNRYRKEVNGHMTKLLETTAGKAAADATIIEKDKAEAKADSKAAAAVVSVPTSVPPITVDKVVVEAKEVNIQNPDKKE